MRSLDELQPDDFIQLANAHMPFGKYRGFYLDEIPDDYWVWLKNKGFPPGEWGIRLTLAYTVKENGLEGLIREIRQRAPAPESAVGSDDGDAFRW